MSGLLTLETYRKFIWDTSKTDLSADRREMRPIRWFLLFWVSIVLLWGCAQVLLGDAVQLPIGNLFLFIQLTPDPFLSTSHHQPVLQTNHIFGLVDLPPALKVVCVVLLSLQFALHWLCLSGKLPQRWYWIYFLFQSLGVLLMGFLWSDPVITLGLYLVLVVEALSMLRPVRQIMLMASSTAVFFLVILFWQLTQLTLRMTFESVLLLVIFLIGWIILSIQQIHARSQLEAAHLQLAAYAMRLEELTLVNERQRLARELHDTLAQDLVGLTLQLERVDLHLEKKRSERARELVQQAMARARSTLAEARSAIDDLRANTLSSSDLVLAVQREIKRFSAATSMACVADISALATTPEILCEHVLRAITEGLTNAARHSQAEHVWISTRCCGEQLTLEVRDDGIGFANAATLATRSGHYGLLGLRERARLCGGSFAIESVVGEGTTLRLDLPLVQRGALL